MTRRGGLGRHIRPMVVEGALLAVMAGALLALGACEGHAPRVEIAHGSGTSAARGLETRTQYLTLDVFTRDGSLATVGFGLTLLGMADPPVVDGVVLQATDVQWMGGRIFATYNVRGDRFLGALQVIDASHPARPRVLAEAVYRDTDLNRVRVAGSNIYAAGADGVAGGTVEHFTFDHGELRLADYLPLGSYSATFLELDGYQAFATSGDVEGGVTVLDLSAAALVATAFLPLHDARWVGTLGGRAVAAVSGSPTTLTVWDDVRLADEAVRDVPVDGANVGAPTWAQIHRDHLYLSSDDAGLLVYDLRDLTEVGRLPTDGTANGSALSMDGKLAFLANGEEGLVMADVMDPAHPAVLAALDVWDDAGSANAVSVRGHLIALADGLGGVKILRFERHAHGAADDCDGDGVPDPADDDDDDDGVLDAADGAPCDPDAACEDGQLDVAGAFVGEFFNLPCDHPDVEGPITGVVRGTLPTDFDWFDERYHAFTAERDSLVIAYGESYFPVDGGLCGDPFYFAAHWRTTALVSESGTYTVALGSDDDGWLFIDGALVIDLGGVHPIARESAEIELTAGAHAIDVWFAERRTVQSGLEFEFVGWPSPTARVDFVQRVCLAADGDADGDGAANAADVAPLQPAPDSAPGADPEEDD